MSKSKIRLFFVGVLLVSACSIVGWFLLQSQNTEQVSDKKEAVVEIVERDESPAIEPDMDHVLEEEPASVSFDISEKSLAMTRPMEILLDNMRMMYPFGKHRQSALYAKLASLSSDEIFELLELAYGDSTLNDMTHVLLEQYAAREPEAVLEFAREKEFGLEPAWWHSVIGGLAEPQLALGDLEALGPSYKQSVYVGHVMNRWAEQDGQAALDYAVQVESEDAQTIAISNVIIGVAREDHAEGMRLAQYYHGDIDDDKLIESVATEWAANDLASARNEILAMPEGSGKQGALVGLAKVTITRDVNTAFSLIEQVEEAVKKRELYLAAALSLYTNEPAAGEQWLATANVLDDVDKQHVREMYQFTQSQR